MSEHPNPQTHTRNHIHRLQMVGIAALLGLGWLALSLSILIPLYSHNVMNYRMILLIEAWSVPIWGLIASLGIVLAVGIVTGRRVRWTLLVSVPWLMVGWGLLILRQNDEASGPVLLLFGGILLIALLHRLFITRHYSKLWDVGSVLLLLVALVIYAIPVVTGGLYTRVEQHLTTVKLGDDTYHLAEVHDFVFSYGANDYGFDEASRTYRKIYESYGFFRCESPHSRCKLIHMDLVRIEDLPDLNLVTDGEIIKITVPGDAFTYDPSE